MASEAGFVHGLTNRMDFIALHYAFALDLVYTSTPLNMALCFPIINHAALLATWGIIMHSFFLLVVDNPVCKERSQKTLN